MQNLISKIDGVTLKYTPSTMTYGLQDVSDSESGRTQDTIMHKNRVAQKRKINLTWNVLRPDEVHELLTMFNPEYIQVTYWDMLDGEEQTREFYVGDRTVPVKFWTSGNKMLNQVAFNIVER